MNFQRVIKRLMGMANAKNAAGMARFGINPEGTLGISVYVLRKIAKEIGKDHQLAEQLWRSRIHEARLLAGYVDEPEKITEEQLERWVKDFDSWDICDQLCALFGETRFARKKIVDWASRDEEFVKRAAFALIAELSVHDKTANDQTFQRFFPIIKRESIDDRNFVRKAVNWALRNIGKRNRSLNRKAIALAKEIKRIDHRAARWIAADALRELTSEKVQRRLEN